MNKLFFNREAGRTNFKQTPHNVVPLLAVFLLSFIFLISFSSALQSNFDIDSGKGGKYDIFPDINYSLIPTVNNSDYLDGYDSSDFYLASNPLGFINSENDPYYFSNPNAYITSDDIPAEVDTLQSVTDRGNTTTNNINFDGTARLDFTQVDDFVSPFAKQQITFNNYSIGATEFSLADGVKSGFQKANTATGNVTFYTLVTDGSARTIFGGGLNGDAYRRFRILSDGQMFWGNGTTDQDTNLYRSATNTLRTDDSLDVSSGILTAGYTTFNSTTGSSIGVTGYYPVFALTDLNGRISRYGSWGAGSGSAYVTTNAYFDGSNWQRDQTDRNSVFLSLDSATTLLRFRYALAGANPITALTAFQVSTLGVLQIPKLSPIADSTTAMQFFKADGTTSILTLDTTNSILKSTGYLDIWYGSPTGAIKVGADVNGITRSSNTRKLASFTAPDYANTRNVEFFNFDSSSSLINALNIGGRSGGSQYGATSIAFLTTATPSTTGGAIAMTITSASKVGIGTTDPQTILHVSGTTTIGTANEVYLVPNYTGNNELPAGALLGNRDTGNFSFFPSIETVTVGAKTVLGYWNGTGRSALEIANVASGDGTLLLMKSGGNVGIGTGTTTPTQKLSVVGGINQTSGNATINNIYGEMWNELDTGFETVDLVTTDVYVKANNFTCGDLNGFSCTNGVGNLTAQVGGKYKVTIKIGATSTLASGDSGMKLYINEVGQNDCYDHEHTSSDPIGFISDCITTLAVGDRLNVRFNDHAGVVSDLVLITANINAVRIGN
jgi:hypothetical protein